MLSKYNMLNLKYIMNIKFVLVGLAFTLMGFYASAQNVKIGFANTDYILSQMPEAKSVDSELRAFEKQLSNKINATVQGLQQQFQQYQQSAATMTEEARANKEKELNELQQQIQRDQQEAQVKLQQKQQELLEPVFTKIQGAIDKVAKANGYTHILAPDAAGNPVILYVQNEEEANISDMVLKELGITPAPANSNTGNQNTGGQNSGNQK